MPRRRRIIVALAPLSTLTVLAVGGDLFAAATPTPSIDARTWRPSMDPRASLVLEPVATSGPGQWNVGVVADYAQDPVVLRQAGVPTLRPLSHGLGAGVVAGIGVGDRADVGISIPMFVWQDGSRALPSTIVSGGTVPKTGLGDISLLGKATIVSNERQGLEGGFGLAALGEVALPTGDRSSFMGEGALTASIRVAAEYALGVAAVRASLGYTVRTETRTWPSPPTAGIAFGDSIGWAFGVVLRPKAVAPLVDSDDRQVWEVAAHGALPAGPVAPFGLGSAGATALSPALVGFDDRIAVGHNRDAYILLGTDIGLNDAVGAPVFRGVFVLGWAPRNHDRDGDGVADDVDQCPDLAEDRDGIQDDDGCPEDDADADEIPDELDACPLVAGSPSPDPKKNGCPPATGAPAPAPAPEATKK